MHQQQQQENHQQYEQQKREIQMDSQIWMTFQSQVPNWGQARIILMSLLALPTALLWAIGSGLNALKVTTFGNFLVVPLLILWPSLRLAFGAWQVRRALEPLIHAQCVVELCGAPGQDATYSALVYKTMPKVQRRLYSLARYMRHRYHNYQDGSHLLPKWWMNPRAWGAEPYLWEFAWVEPPSPEYRERYQTQFEILH
jgi:hypothetical protein